MNRTISRQSFWRHKASCTTSLIISTSRTTWNANTFIMVWLSLFATIATTIIPCAHEFQIPQPTTCFKPPAQPATHLPAATPNTEAPPVSELLHTTTSPLKIWHWYYQHPPSDRAGCRLCPPATRPTGSPPKSHLPRKHQLVSSLLQLRRFPYKALAVNANYKYLFYSPSCSPFLFPLFSCFFINRIHFNSFYF